MINADRKAVLRFVHVHVVQLSEHCSLKRLFNFLQYSLLIAIPYIQLLPFNR